MKKLLTTAERVSSNNVSDNYVYQRSLLAYQHVSKLVSGKVLEIGTGEGYGIHLISANVSEFITLDKSSIPVEQIMQNNQVKFIKMKAPSLKGIPSNYFDFVISFQVIEHIKDDQFLIEEIQRVLKVGGKFMLTTPNSKMSLVRNPWHVREYTSDQLRKVLSTHLLVLETNGVFGDKLVSQYYAENKKKVIRIQRWDILRLNQWLPRILLQIPFDIFNRLNRQRLSKYGKEITTKNFWIGPVEESCLDFFFIAEKYQI